jgi:2-polyprenyl-3-methyl-5-hydroxy-6-metoxy-1,4-benzoquinol methylase
MMDVDRLNDLAIIESWHKNAAPWTIAIQAGQIESRQLITNAAIIQAIVDRSPQTILDIGCGEGWLVRALCDRGVQAMGVDVISSLIDRAKQAETGEFHVASYADLAANKLQVSVDAIVCNFSLLGQQSVIDVFTATRSLLNKDGYLIVQTIHPVFGCGDLPYRDEWRSGSWAGFSDDFTDPAPWYFRTLSSWIDLFVTHGLQIIEIQEPIHPHTHKPASIIFISKICNQ